MTVEFRRVLLTKEAQRGVGKIYLHSMPGRFEPWGEFSQACRSKQVENILCLTSLSEISVKSPNYSQAIAEKKSPAVLIFCPVADFSTPADLAHYHQCIEQLADRLLKGENVLIHCAAGIGRTGTAAACLLIEMSVPANKAIEQVVKAGSKAETQRQLHFINSFGLYRSE